MYSAWGFSRPSDKGMAVEEHAMSKRAGRRPPKQEKSRALEKEQLSPSFRAS